MFNRQRRNLSFRFEEVWVPQELLRELAYRDSGDDAAVFQIDFFRVIRMEQQLQVVLVSVGLRQA